MAYFLSVKLLYWLYFHRTSDRCSKTEIYRAYYFLAFNCHKILFVILVRIKFMTLAIAFQWIISPSMFILNFVIIYSVYLQRLGLIKDRRFNYCYFNDRAIVKSLKRILGKVLRALYRLFWRSVTVLFYYLWWSFYCRVGD